jgi:integrase
LPLSPALSSATSAGEKDAKSGKSRTVALPAMVVTELRRWKAAQAEELLRLGIRTDDDTHVVSLTHAVSAFLEPWGITMHKLRHSHASHLLASAIHPKIVQERLGHSSISITIDTYSHLMPNMQSEAAAAIDVALGKG